MREAAATEELFQLHNLTSHPAHPLADPPLPQNPGFVPPVLVLSSPPLQCWEQGEERPNLVFFPAKFRVLGVFSMP